MKLIASAEFESEVLQSATPAVAGFYTDHHTPRQNPVGFETDFPSSTQGSRFAPAPGRKPLPRWDNPEEDRIRTVPVRHRQKV